MVKLSLQVGQNGRNRFTFGIAMTHPQYHSLRGARTVAP